MVKKNVSVSSSTEVEGEDEEVPPVKKAKKVVKKAVVNEDEGEEEVEAPVKKTKKAPVKKTTALANSAEEEPEEIEAPVKKAKKVVKKASMEEEEEEAEAPVKRVKKAPIKKSSALANNANTEGIIEHVFSDLRTKFGGCSSCTSTTF